MLTRWPVSGSVSVRAKLQLWVARWLPASLLTSTVKISPVVRSVKVMSKLTGMSTWLLPVTNAGVHAHRPSRPSSMAVVAAHRFMYWPPHWDEDGCFVVKVGLGAPHPTGVVHVDWLLYPEPCLSPDVRSVGLFVSTADAGSWAAIDRARLVSGSGRDAARSKGSVSLDTLSADLTESYWSSLRSPTEGSAPAPRPRPPRPSGRCHPQRSLPAAGAGPRPRPGRPWPGTRPRARPGRATR